jgi:inosine/guanosine/xanthosine phosphorylase family protein
VLPFLIANEICKGAGFADDASLAASLAVGTASLTANPTANLAANPAASLAANPAGSLAADAASRAANPATRPTEGARLAIFTNAAGAINEGYAVGDLMIIKDHINFTGQSLLTLNEASDFGGSSMDMSYAYAPAYREMLKGKAYKSSRVHEGVYLGVRGAMFETPAEIRAFRAWGADAVGMSTIHEVEAANRLEIDAVGISVMANMAAGVEAKKLTLEEVLENTAETADELTLLIGDLLSML